MVEGIQVWAHALGHMTPFLPPLCVTHNTGALLLGVACSSGTPPMAVPPP